MGWLEEKYGGGDTKIYYAKNPLCVLLPFKPEECDVDVSDLEKTHTLLGTVPFDEEENVFYHMQGEQWSPHGEAKGEILEKGLAHTSMSIGDIVEMPNGDVMMVDAVGFRRLGKGRRT